MLLTWVTTHKSEHDREGIHFLYPCTGVPRLSELCLQATTVLQDGYLQSLVSRNVLPEALAAAVRDHRRKMRVYKPQAIVLPG